MAVHNFQTHWHQDNLIQAPVQDRTLRSWGYDNMLGYNGQRTPTSCCSQALKQRHGEPEGSNAILATEHISGRKEMTKQGHISYASA